MKAKDATAHDPKTGQFASSASGGNPSKGEQANSRREHQESRVFHEKMARHHSERGERDAAEAHSNAANSHHEAAEEHGNVKSRSEGARSLTYMSQAAREASIHANHASGYGKGFARDRRSSAPVTGDSKRGTKTMPTTAKLSPTAAVALGALTNYLSPRLAQDHKIDLKTILLGTTAKNLPDRAAKIARDVKRACRGRLAQDADVDDVEEVIDAIQEMAPEIAEAASEPDQEDLNAVTENDDDAHDSPELLAKSMEFLKDKLSPEDLNAYAELMGEENVVDPAEEAHDETEEERMKREAEDADAGSPRGGAMDAKAVRRAVKLAVDSAVAEVRENTAALREAERFVRPLVGELGIACDSAEEVYRHALKMRGISDEALKKIPSEGYRPMLEALPRQITPRTPPSIAADAKPEGSFRERFPGVARIGLR